MIGTNAGAIWSALSENGAMNTKDLKKAAKVSGNKNCDLIPMKDLLPTTGYIRGGCSPIGMKKPFPTYIHTTAADFDHIYISAGVRGLQIQIAPTDLITVSNATLNDLIL